MNKRELVWLIVRLIGVYLAYSAIITFFALASAVWGLYSLTSADSAAKTEIENTRTPAGSIAPPSYRPPNEPNAVSAKADPAAEKLKSDAFKAILLDLLLLGIYGGLGYYFIMRGVILFNILNSEARSIREQEPTVTTLKL